MQRITALMAFGFLATGLVQAGPANAQPRAYQLPEGEGHDVVESVCTSCHRASYLPRSMGYSAEDWREFINTMVDLSDAPDVEDDIVAYLAVHFPPDNPRPSTTVEGTFEISFDEWQVPTPGQRARDPVEDQDGEIWWVGQWGDILGRLNVSTGAFTEYPLPAGAKPHSVTIDADGNAWYTGNRNATIGKLDPQTGEITEYHMPDPAARDPHTAVFDDEGILWFTLQGSNMVGRLDPETGAIDLRTMPTERSRPYGIKVDATGNLWVACNGSNCLVKVDAKSFDLTEYKLPLEGTTVRRLDIDSTGIIWYVNSSLGRLGRFDPATAQAREWPSPSGPNSHPYALAVIDDIVWYNESGVRPDMLVRFEPETETFQSWPIKSGGVYAGIARHIRPTRAGDLLIHQTAAGRIIRVNIPPRETTDGSDNRSD